MSPTFNVEVTEAYQTERMVTLQSNQNRLVGIAADALLNLVAGAAVSAHYRRLLVIIKH